MCIIPAGTTEIFIDAFDGCSKITSIKIPACVKKIESAAFDGLDLESIDVDVNNLDFYSEDNCLINKIDTIDYYLALIDSKNPKYVIPHSRESLVNMRNILEKYKNDAINRKLPEVNYGISIQYPTGYEG